MGGIVPPNLSHGEHQSLQCFPLYSFLLALANPTVHLLSLDIEGAEFEVWPKYTYLLVPMILF